VGHRPDALGRFKDYLERPAAAYAAEEITDFTEIASEDDLVARGLASIERFRPYRDEFVALCRDVARYGGDRVDVFDALHQFFEGLATTRLSHHQRRFRAEAETDNLAFIGWELMLYATSLLLQHHQYSGLARLLRPMYVNSSLRGGALRAIDVLEPGFPLIARHYDRQQQRWSEPAAHMLRQRHREADGVRFETLTAADLLLWYRTVTDPDLKGGWVPRTLAFLESGGPSPLFARARSATEFARLAPARCGADRPEFVRRVRAVPETQYYAVGRMFGGRRAYEYLLGIGQDE
jgi:hypothetical protein